MKYVVAVRELLLCRKLELPEIHLALVYFDIGSQKETVLSELYSATALRQYFEERCERFLAWAEQELAYRAARDRALTAWRFPHSSFRPGQRQLAEAVHRAASTGCCLQAEAPTGTGKTISTLFPLLKTCPGRELDKIFFLAAGARSARRSRGCLSYRRQVYARKCASAVAEVVEA